MNRGGEVRDKNGGEREERGREGKEEKEGSHNGEFVREWKEGRI